MIKALFPGDRRVWAAAGIVLAVMAALVGWQLLKPREVILGTNSAAVRGHAQEVGSGQDFCLRRIRVPDGTQRLRIWVDTRDQPRPAIDVRMRVWDGHDRRGKGTIIRGYRPATSDPGFGSIDIPLDAPVPDLNGRGFRFADICFTPRGGSFFPWGMPGGTMTDRVPLLDGKPIDPVTRPALWFLPKDHETRPLVAQLGTVFHRASLFRAGFIGPWTYWLLFLIVTPATFYVGVRLLAGAATRTLRRSAIGIYLITVAVGATWAMLTPTFHTPDESEHFGAVQYFAETGKWIAAAPDPKRPIHWSTEEAVAIDATRLLATFERQDVKLPWLDSYELAWQERHKNHGKPLPKDDGGGYHPAVSSHSPAYYALVSPAYLAARNHSPFAQVLAVRWFNSLLAGITALMAFLAVAELLPGRRELAVGAGLLVAFEPMFGFMAGATNNDNAVNAACAAAVWLCVRGLRRGLQPGVGAALGAVLALAPIFKATGYALAPPALLAVGFMLLRGRRVPKTWLGVAAGIAAFAAVTIAWSLIAPTFDRSTYTTPGGGSPTGVAGLHNLRLFASWMWQVMVPWTPPFLHDLTIVKWPFFNIYIERGFGAFGWYGIYFPTWVYAVVLAVIVGVVALGVRLVRVDWEDVKRRLPEGLFLLAVPLTVLLGVEAAYINLGPEPYDGTPEQGRYMFPAIAALAALISVAALGAGRRRGGAVLVVTVLVAALMGMTYGGQVLMFQSFYGG